MKRTIRLIIALAIVMGAASSCKSKQQITEVPAGAFDTTASTEPAPTEAPVATQEVEEEVNNAFSKPAKAVANTASAATSAANAIKTQAKPAVTRNENFTLVNGESAALKNKYHVVVGSFSKAENAQGLQTALKGEGKNALVVKNETGMFRVLIASFNDYYKAHDYIKQIGTRFPDAWVLVQK